jgi:hypothetical protein
MKRWYVCAHRSILIEMQYTARNMPKRQRKEAMKRRKIMDQIAVCEGTEGSKGSAP